MWLRFRACLGDLGSARISAVDLFPLVDTSAVNR
jgi:hypothetical protein